MSTSQTRPGDNTPGNAQTILRPIEVKYEVFDLLPAPIRQAVAAAGNDFDPIGVLQAIHQGWTEQQVRDFLKFRDDEIHYTFYPELKKAAK